MYKMIASSSIIIGILRYDIQIFQKPGRISIEMLRYDMIQLVRAISVVLVVGCGVFGSVSAAYLCDITCSKVS